MSNMSNSMVTFISPALDVKYPFWANSIGNIKIVCLTRNLLPKLFEYTEINDNIQIFSFGPEIPSLGKFGRKIRYCLFKIKFGP